MDTANAFAVAEKAVHAEPARPEMRHQVATLCIQNGKYDSALAVLAGTSSQGENLDDLVESLSLRAIARSCVEGLTFEDLALALRQAQKAIMLCPWQIRYWQALAFVRTKTVK
jgi:superkiller protein 3